MPLTIPPFAQYQAPLIPLRGLWNAAPVEGDKVINAEIDWGTLGGSPAYTSCQFQLSGNSPVALSQIAALYVDNSRCGSDAVFTFPDSSFRITIPARAQALVPVISNALTFYASASGAQAGDTTILQICNSMPPPIPLSIASTQTYASVSGVNLAVVAPTVMVSAPTSGTVQALSVSLDVTAAGTTEVGLQDGTGSYVWIQEYTFVVAQVPASVNINLSPLNIRFANGLNFVVIAATGGVAGAAIANVYYRSP